MMKELYFGKRIFSFYKFKEAILNCYSTYNYDDYDYNYLYALYTLSYRVVDRIDWHEYKSIRIRNCLAVDIALSILDPKYIYSSFEYKNIDEAITIIPCQIDSTFGLVLYDILKYEIPKHIDEYEKFFLNDKIDYMLSRYHVGLFYSETPMSNFAMTRSSGECEVYDLAPTFDKGGLAQ